MSLRENVLRDLYGDELNYEYHQDYRDGELLWQNHSHVVVPAILLAGAVLYTAFHSFSYGILALSETIWNWIVYLTPSRLIDLVDIDCAATGPAPRLAPRTHAAKSEIMRRVLRLDKSTGIMGSVAQASRRRLSSMPGINIVARDEDGHPAGLGNWDNSCYQNSVLQGLASLDTFSNYLKGPFPESAGTAENPDMRMANSLRGLLTSLRNPSNNGKRIWTPAALKPMSSWQQQDAQEYFSKILDEVDKEIEKAAGLNRSQGLTTHEQVEPAAKQSQTPGISSAKNPLEGLLAQRVGCTRCGYSEGLSMIPFNCLTVPLGKSWSYDISQCLDEYTELESIEGVQCGRCTLLEMERLLKILIERSPNPTSPGQISTLERLAVVKEALEEDDYEDKTLTQKCKIPPKNRVTSTKSRQGVIARPPKSLVVHVNRSIFDEMTGELKKNYAEVRFQSKFDLGPWCLGSIGEPADGSVEEWLLDPAKSMITDRRAASRQRGPIYELRAVIIHTGRHENGHYITYRKHPSGKLVDEQEESVKETREQWWRFSDDDVSRVSEDNVLNQGGVFMLFYDLIETSSFTSPGVPSSGSVEEATEPQKSDLMEFVKARHPEFLSAPKHDTSMLEQTDAPLAKQKVDEVASDSTLSDDKRALNDGASENYEHSKPLHFKPMMRTMGVQRDERKDSIQGAAGSMVMV